MEDGTFLEFLLLWFNACWSATCTFLEKNYNIDRKIFTGVQKLQLSYGVICQKEEHVYSNICMYMFAQSLDTKQQCKLQIKPNNRL